MGGTTHQPTMPSPPAAWIAIQTNRFSRADLAINRKVVGAFPRPDDPELLALVKSELDEHSEVLTVELDRPELEVTHYGISIYNPCWLTCRDIWFQRHAKILEPYLRNPEVAKVFTFSPGELLDPLTTYKSSAAGPFTFPVGTTWPSCGFCHHPLAFLGALDFRDYRTLRLPGASLVLHVCNNCGVYADPEAWSLTWVKEGEPVEILGDRNQPVLVGTPWFATEYPLPAIYPHELARSGYFLDEDSIYFNFCCFADKIGGNVFHIHMQEEHPTDSRGQPMVYIGQFVGTDDVEIGDSGIAYIYYSPATGVTLMYPESF